MGRLTGKRAIITGAGSGIGRASAELFAAEGARVLAADRDGAAVAAVCAAIVKAGGDARAVAIDASEECAVKDLVAKAAADWSGLDVFYANAGISGGATPLLEQSVALWQEVLRVNLIGPFLAIKHAAPVMVRRRAGAILCTASVAGLRANAGRSAYAASKAGVISLVQTAANELRHPATVYITMKQPPINDPAYWRERAEEARRIAKELADPVTKETMLDISRSYENLAKITDERPAA
jgi:NAD(P)-dependent dehydrogenase (short-subunit alcohol dehydrogenase family)